MGVITHWSAFFGTTEPALRLLLAVFAGYPIAALYRTLLYGRYNENVHHLFFIVFGILLGYSNYGYDVVHPLSAILVSFGLLRILGGTRLAVGSVFIFNMAYLLVGYYYTGTENYDINWCMPQCVLVLRLIATAFDLYDGTQMPASAARQPFDPKPDGNNLKMVALDSCPSLLEFSGHMLFPASVIVGPQFSLKRYRAFLSGAFGDVRLSTWPAFRRFAFGVIYLGVYQLLGQLVDDDYMVSDQFSALPFWRRLLLLGVWGRYTLYKYISCWLLSEGACILFGVAYNGQTADGHVHWNGVENIRLAVFENATKFSHYIQSFNVNTNQWVAHYIYKRLKFMGNRHISQLFALLFLAIWHGFHSGYFVCFAFEFLVINVERDAIAVIGRSERLQRLFNDNNMMRILCYVLLRMYTFVFMGWCLIPFALLTFDRYWLAYKAVNHAGTLLFGTWICVMGPLLHHFTRPKNVVIKHTEKLEETRKNA